jgi:hypothetical protein
VQSTGARGYGASYRVSAFGLTGAGMRGWSEGHDGSLAAKWSPHPDPVPRPY